MTTATSMFESHDGGDFRGEAFKDGGLDTVALLTGQHLSAHFEEDAPIVGRVHASPNWYRVKRRMFMFSPILAIFSARRSLL